MKFNNFFIVFLLILVAICIPVTALNETPIIEKVTMHVYGNAYYANGLPLPSGTIIVAKDQFGSRIGSYTIREKGKIGKEFGGSQDNFAINVWRNQSDKTNRTLPIYVSFYINNATTGDLIPFQQNENVPFDIKVSYLPPEITVVTKTPQPTQVVSSTLITTTVAINETIVQTTSDPMNFGWSTNDYILYGILFAIVCVVGILVAGVAISYTIDKTSRDDIMGPDGEWKDK